MRILFAMKHPAELCALSGVVSLLAERGHSVHLAFGGVKTAGSMAVVERLAEEQPRLTFGSMPPRGDSVWASLSEDLRRSVDFLRYLDPIYAEAPKLRARRERGAPATTLRLARLARLAGPRGACTLRKTLQSLERCILPAPEAESFVARHAPDLVLGTHLETIGSGHADLVRVAKRLGIRTGYLVYSWDNLTNKGLIRDVPDVVLVWNDLQAREARELHGVPAGKVRVTGAPPFDHWFSWSPSCGREEFSRRVGLRADRPIVLYTCSSKFIAPKEVAFVRRWVEALRASGGALADAGILVRPHPRNAERWKDEELALPQVSVWPRLGQEPVDDEARRNYFDSILHSAAVVGINTSAQIESAIVGRPVHTLLADEFAATQEGTLHFRYLRADDFGHLNLARTMEDHVKLLEASVRDGPADERNERFVARFVRPFGRDVAAAPLVADALEEVGAQPAVRPASGPGHAPLVRLALRPLAAASKRRRAVADEPRGARQPRDVVRELAEEQSTEPVVAGPWLGDEIGELLYWIPFLRWAQSATIGLRDRLVVAARGDRGYWYAGIGSRVVPFEELGVDVAPRLAPHVVAAARSGLAQESSAARLRDRQLEFEPLPAPELPAGLALPDEFTAVHFRFGLAFPESEANVQLAGSVVGALAACGRVAVVDAPEAVVEALSETNPHVVPGDSWEALSAVVARADALIGSYGAAAYLAALHGVPALAIYTDPGGVDPDDLRVALSFLAEPPYGQVRAIRAPSAEEIAKLAGALLGRRAEALSAV
jgi:hypothetical protein